LWKELQNTCQRTAEHEVKFEGTLNSLLTKVGDKSNTQRCSVKLGWPDLQLGSVCVIPLISTK